jgi:putative copper export protein
LRGEELGEVIEENGALLHLVGTGSWTGAFIFKWFAKTFYDRSRPVATSELNSISGISIEPKLHDE